ncbi:ABC transporter substrate-binding protein [Brevibacterium album]|uniref:ABC transporter substrate-binding protein n=1 Tax=Brevibacterium album TaxID=417948 RepID=UPI000405DA23|nr:ABC transporter substrate-binding protein [Brevibacterium album]
MSNKRWAGLMAAAVLSVAASGCGASEPMPVESAAAQGEGSTEYPLTLENCGREITIEEAPQRAVSLDQNSTEILLSLGLEDRMAGTASWTDPVLEPLAAANDEVPRLADDAPTYEVLLDSDPDFVTASFGRHFNAEGGVAPRDRLAETGIESYLSPTDCEDGTSINGGGTRTRQLALDALHQEIRDLAAIFDVPERGEQLIAELEDRTEAAQEGLDLEGASAAFWFADTRTPYVAGGLGSASLLATLSGMGNAYADTPDDWPASGWEAFVEREPQIIVLGDLHRDRFPGDRLQDKIDFLESDPLTRTLPAVRDECYIALHGAEMNPSIRYVDGLEKIQAWASGPDAERCAASGH